jgi:hypothetical protein
MTGAVWSHTPHIKLGLLEFNFPNWGDDANLNMQLIDAALGLSGITIDGAWTNSTAYAVGTLIVDQDMNSLWRCSTSHTSAAAPTTFLQDRTAHPTYWASADQVLVPRGMWTTATVYYANDVVYKDAYKYSWAMGTQTFTSGASYDADVAAGKLVIITDTTSTILTMLPIISDTVPVGTFSPGQQWWQSSSGNMYIYYNDGDSVQWVPSYVGALPEPAEIVAVDWTDITGKPATFPPTVPIAWADISGEPATYPPDVHTHSYSSLTSIPSTFPPDAHTHSYSSLTSIPSTFAPSAHSHTAADVTNFSEAVDDRVNGLLVAGTNVTLTYNDAANTMTIAATGGGGGAYVDEAGDTMTGTLNLKSSLVMASGTSLYIGADTATATSSVYYGGVHFEHKIGSTNVLYMDIDGVQIGTKLWTQPSTTSRAGMVIWPGVAPTTPMNGDVWVTSTSMYAHINSTTVDLAATDTAAQILTKLLTVDGSGSTLDADLLDAQSGSYYLNRTNHTGTQATSTVTGLDAALSALDGQDITLQAAINGKVSDTGDTMTGSLELPNGSTSIVSLRFGSAAGTGIYGDTSAVYMSMSGTTKFSFLSGGFISAAPITAPAPTTSTTSLNMAHGTAPTAPNNGDLWTTTAGMYLRTNGATVGPFMSSAAYTAADVLAKMLTVDGAGSGLDADLLDGLSSAAFATASHTHTASNITDFSEAVDDRVGSLLVAGSNITLNYDDTANTLSITSTAAGGGGGDVTGPVSSVNDRIALFSGTTGKVIKDGGILLSAKLDASAYTAADVLAKLLTVDSTGSLLDADFLDTQSGAYYLDRTNHTGTQSADTLTNGTTNKVFTATEQTKLTGIATGATANSSDATLLARANHTGTQSADTITDGTTNKAYTATEKTKLAGIATGATANSSDATLLARANHTGTQTASTISDFNTAADARITNAVGVTVQAYDADLTSWGAITPSTKLDTSAYTAADVLTKIKTVDGATSGLDADLLDAQEGTYYLARANHTGTQSADTLTDGTTNKAFLATERTKLTGIATGATANSSDATLLARANHTGTQVMSTISDAGTAATRMIHVGTSAPGSPATNDIWIDTT